MIKTFCFIVFSFIFGIAHSLSQPVNTEKKTEKEIDPKTRKGLSNVQKATLYSIIPGGGQIYNGKYWKVPIIYAGFGLLTYSFVFYNNVYNDVRQSYIQRINNEPVTDPEYANVPTEMLYSLRESYRKSRDLSVIGIAALYTFNLIDAAVDAHLKEFDVSDKLTLKIKPEYHIGYRGAYTGLALNLRF